MRLTVLFLGILVVGCTAISPYEPREHEEDNSYLETSDGDSRTDGSENDARFARPSDLVRPRGYGECPENTFLGSTDRCHSCAVCGPDLYELKACTALRNTVCDWCLNPNRVQNANYRVKCAHLVQLQGEFDSLLEKRLDGIKPTGKRRPTLSSSSSSSSSSAAFDSDAGYVSDNQLPMRITFIRPIFSDIAANKKQSASDSNAANFLRYALRPRPFPSLTYKVHSLLEILLYGTLIVLLFALIRFVMRARTPHYRTVTVNPPVLDESDKKNIIRAADEIREKLGQKGYNRLEEFI